MLTKKSETLYSNSDSQHIFSQQQKQNTERQTTRKQPEERKISDQEKETREEKTNVVRRLFFTSNFGGFSSFFGIFVAQSVFCVVYGVGSCSPIQKKNLRKTKYDVILICSAFLLLVLDDFEFGVLFEIRIELASLNYPEKVDELCLTLPKKQRLTCERTQNRRMACPKKKQ